MILSLMKMITFYSSVKPLVSKTDVSVSATGDGLEFLDRSLGNRLIESFLSQGVL